MGSDAEFESHRKRLEGIAYRMLGTLADAQDAVQETWLRWRSADPAGIREPRAWLSRVCARQALDQLASARARRESYTGIWLPEPWTGDAGADPAAEAELDESVSMALMLVLERLSPGERAAFILADVFGFRFDEIAAVLEKTTAACRKLASRARESVRRDRPGTVADAAQHRRLLHSFVAAARSGDVEGLKGVLAEDVELRADGGGKAAAAAAVLRGRDAVGAFLAKVWAEAARRPLQVVDCRFNGGPGLLVYEDGMPATAISIEVSGGAIRRIFGQRNPDKLAALHRSVDEGAPPAREERPDGPADRTGPADR